MRKLLRANFARLFKNSLFRAMMLLSVAMGIFFPLKRYYDMQKMPEYYAEMPDSFKCAEGFVFSGALHIMFFAVIMLGSYIGTEYSDGTLRNKILVGHERTEIFLANFMTGAAASLFLMLSEMACVFAVGKMVFTVSIMGVGEILVCLLMESLSMVALTTLIMLILMLIPNKAASSVFVFGMTVLLFCVGMVISSRLHEQEYYTEVEITGTDDAGNPVVEQINEKNPHYPEGTKRKMYEFLYDSLPVCQFLQIAYEEYGRMDVMAGYACLICIVNTGGGLLLFDKKDLK